MEEETADTRPGGNWRGVVTARNLQKTKIQQEERAKGSLELVVLKKTGGEVIFHLILRRLHLCSRKNVDLSTVILDINIVA